MDVVLYRVARRRKIINRISYIPAVTSFLITATTFPTTTTNTNSTTTTPPPQPLPYRPIHYAQRFPLLCIYFFHIYLLPFASLRLFLSINFFFLSLQFLFISFIFFLTYLLLFSSFVFLFYCFYVS